MVNVGKYTSPMDPMGKDCLFSEPMFLGGYRSSPSPFSVLVMMVLGCFFRQVKHEEETAPIVLEGEPRSVAVEPEKKKHQTI